MGGFLLTYGVMRLLGRNWTRRAPDWAAVYRQKQQRPFDHDYEI
jgi:hypothetical protein